ncbi:thiolase family protein [Thalassoglobus sp.]|uniref:thiolase family protein n=1 Tax=Thalassoglobus sp. TaxID=2795869 RepID=UPI003AA7AD01
MSNTMKRVVIVSAKRTPFGRLLGALADQSPVDLAVAAGQAALNGIDRQLVDQVILGNVLSAGHGMNIARQVGVQLGLPISTPAQTVNMMCGSGMQTALQAVQTIRAGDANVVLAGGAESMSQSPLIVKRPGKKQEPDFEKIIDSMQRDGLVDSFSDHHMGMQAEELATEFYLSREQQDAFAQRSQHLFGVAANEAKYSDEVVPMDSLIADQHPRPEVTREQLSELRTVFRKDGTITAGNASGINDGAAMLLLAEREFAMEQNWPILAEWVDGVVVGCEPERMGLGPVHAISKLQQRTNSNWNEIDTLEINEAFAAQTLACLHQLELNIDLDAIDRKVSTSSGHLIDFNSEGGAIAIGHPLAVSGARLLSHLAWKISNGNSTCAIGSLCIGGGMGIAAMLKSHQ